MMLIGCSKIMAIHRRAKRHEISCSRRRKIRQKNW